MKSKGNARVGMSGSGIFRKGEIPYYVDNLFYESFGMSCDEVLETLKKSDFFEHE